MGKNRRTDAFAAVAAFAVTGLLAACGSSSGGQNCDPTPDPTYNPVIDPANFVAIVDNPLWPLVPGTRTVFESEDETVEVTVTSDTKVILGVTAVVVRDTVTEDGEITEDTFDWFAQDVDGNVWYLGEDSKEYEDGELVGTEGSWEAGVDGAKPGIVMHGVQPPVGEPYRQEYYPCQAEDMAEVVSLNESVTVPYGSFDNCLETHEFTPLEPKADEHKFYCPGIGVVLEVDQNSGDRTELTELENP